MRVSSKVSLAQPKFLFAISLLMPIEVVLAQQRSHGNGWSLRAVSLDALIKQGYIAL